MKLSIVLAALTFTSAAAAESASGLEVRDEGRTDSSSSTRRSARIVGFADAAVRVGPVGAMLTTGVYYRRALDVDEPSGVERSYLQAGVSLGVNPAYLEPQAHVEYAPVPFLALRADIAATRYFGTNYGLLRFDSPDADFGDEALSERRGEEHDAWAAKGRFSLVPRAKFGPMVLGSTLSFTGYRYDDPGPYVYEPELDTLLSTTDFVFLSRSEALVQLHTGPGAEALMLGPMLESLRTIDTELSRTRLGALAYYVPSEHWGNFRRPRLFAMAGINLSDPNRKGEPFAMLGFGADVE